MMKYNFDEIVNRRNTGSTKWDHGDFLKTTGLAERFDENTLPLFTADMDIAVPPCIVEALHKTVDHRIYGYTQPTFDYFDSIVKWLKKRHNWDVRHEEIINCPGTVHALRIAIRAYTNPGDAIIIQRPVYGPFTRVIEESNRIVANNQMIKDDDGYYSINLAEFEELAKKAETKLFFLCNPHNPTGRIFDKDTLSKLSRICKENGVLIVADEIHGDLIRKDQSFTPIELCSESADHIISCTAINKTFNVAGLRATNIIIKNPEIKKAFTTELRSRSISPFTMAAVIAAYSEAGEEWLEELKVYFDETIDWVMDFLNIHLPKVKCVRPEGTYTLWMDFNKYGLSPEELRKKIYVNANVILESGTLFDPDKGQGFERICLSSPRPLIQEALIRIAKEFEGL